MEEPPPLQLPASEHASSLHLGPGPVVQTGLDLLQPPASLQLQHLLVHRADQVLEENQSLTYSLGLLLVACEAAERDTVMSERVLRGRRSWGRGGRGGLPFVLSRILWMRTGYLVSRWVTSRMHSWTPWRRSRGPRQAR